MSNASEFKAVFSDVKASDAFYKFLQVVFNLYPEDRFHHLLQASSNTLSSDEDIYKHVQSRLPSIKPFLSELRYALPALQKQKKEMTRQTLEMLGNSKKLNGYVEIGSTGRYISHLRKQVDVTGPVYLINDYAPNNSLPEIMERGGFAKAGTFIDLNNYDPITEQTIPSESIDIVTCFIGLHHAPVDKLEDFVQSIHRILREGGRFIIRDHDVRSSDMDLFCSLVHTVFNLGTNDSWQTNALEYRRFQSIDQWSDYVCSLGFKDCGHRILQAHDPSANTLIKLEKL